MAFSHLDSWTHESWLWKEEYQILYTKFRVHTASWRMPSQFCKVFLCTWHHSWLFREAFTYYFKPASWNDGEYEKTREFHGHGSVAMCSLLHFLCYVIIFLVGRDAMWNTMTVEKAFYKSMYGSSGGSICVQRRKIHIENKLIF